MRRISLADVESLSAELADHTRQLWPPPPEVLRRLGVELAPPSTHAVVRADIDGEQCAIKIFRSWARGEADREWALLTILQDSGFAPLPIWRSCNDDPPVVVTRWLDGRALVPNELTLGDMSAIGRAHETIHSLSAPADLPIAVSAASTTRDRVLTAWGELPALATQLGVDAAVMKRLAGEPFAASTAVDEAMKESPLLPCRGDTHIKNYLRDGSAVRLLDFEDAGLAQPLFELADMIEHFGNRYVHEDMWRELVEIAGVPSDSLAAERALYAEFWLTIIIRRGARGLAMSPPVSAGEQLERLARLGAYAQ